MNKYNVLLIVIDDLRADHLGCYGYNRNTSPNIDVFAKKGIIFKNAISQAAWTKPSIASLFTSLYPFQHMTGAGENNFHHLNKNCITLAEKLKNSGYCTLAITSSSVVEDCDYDNGFSEFIKSKEDSKIKDLLLTRLKSDVPFFVYLHYDSCHAPFKPSKKFDKFDVYGGKFILSNSNKQLVQNKKFILSENDLKTLIAKYDGEILYVDYLIGELLKDLDKGGILKNTLVIITADHGEAFLEHGLVWHESRQLYNELIKIPLIVILKGVIDKNRKSNNIVRAIDIAPTILDLLEIEPESSFEGDSLFEDHEFAISQSIDWGIAQSIENKNYKLIIRYDRDWELYDKKTDPFERKNIFDKNKYKETIDDFKKNAFPEFKPIKRVKTENDKKIMKKLKELGYF
jgi:arylsulfatase A-like enzyme